MFTSTLQCHTCKYQAPKYRQNLNPLNANPTKWSNTLKQFVANLLTYCLSVFDHFVGLALKGLRFLAVHFVKIFIMLQTIIHNYFKVDAANLKDICRLKFAFLIIFRCTYWNSACCNLCAAVAFVEK